MHFSAYGGGDWFIVLNWTSKRCNTYYLQSWCLTFLRGQSRALQNKWYKHTAQVDVVQIAIKYLQCQQQAINAGPGVVPWWHQTWVSQREHHSPESSEFITSWWYGLSRQGERAFQGSGRMALAATFTTGSWPLWFQTSLHGVPHFCPGWIAHPALIIITITTTFIGIQYT